MPRTKKEKPVQDNEYALNESKGVLSEATEIKSSPQNDLVEKVSDTKSIKKAKATKLKDKPAHQTKEKVPRKKKNEPPVNIQDLLPNDTEERSSKETKTKPTEKTKKKTENKAKRELSDSFESFTDDTLSLRSEESGKTEAKSQKNIKKKVTEKAKSKVTNKRAKDTKTEEKPPGKPTGKPPGKANATPKKKVKVVQSLPKKNTSLGSKEHELFSEFKKKWLNETKTEWTSNDQDSLSDDNTPEIVSESASESAHYSTSSADSKYDNNNNNSNSSNNEFSKLKNRLLNKAKNQMSGNTKYKLLDEGTSLPMGKAYAELLNEIQVDMLGISKSKTPNKTDHQASPMSQEKQPSTAPEESSGNKRTLSDSKKKAPKEKSQPRKLLIDDFRVQMPSRPRGRPKGSFGKTFFQNNPSEDLLYNAQDKTLDEFKGGLFADIKKKSAELIKAKKEKEEAKEEEDSSETTDYQYSEVEDTLVKNTEPASLTQASADLWVTIQGKEASEYESDAEDEEALAERKKARARLSTKSKKKKRMEAKVKRIIQPEDKPIVPPFAKLSRISPPKYPTVEKNEESEDYDPEESDVYMSEENTDTIKNRIQPSIVEPGDRVTMQQVAEHNYSYGVFVYQRPKLLTVFWEEEMTMCYQVEYKTKRLEVFVSRRYDNDMINLTKLLNAVRMSRGRRDGLLKNEVNRVVVTNGSNNLKGIWVPFSQAVEMAQKYNIYDTLFPLFEEDPTIYLTASDPPVFYPSMPMSM